MMSTLNGNGPLEGTADDVAGSFAPETPTESPATQQSGNNVLSNGLPQLIAISQPVEPEPMDADYNFPRIVKQEPNVHNAPREGSLTPVDIKPSPSTLEPIASETAAPVAASSIAEKRTLVIVKIIEQTILNGIVVDEQVRENEFVSKGGYSSWPEASVIPSFPPAGACSSSSSSSSVSASQPSSNAQSSRLPSTPPHPSTSRPVPSSSGHRGPGRPPSNKNSCNSRNSHSSRGSASKRATSRSHHETSGSERNKRVKVEVKEEHESEEERMMRETASTLLALHAESPVKKVDSDTNDSHGDLSETEFQPLHLGSFVLAKWNDKNFYPGHVRSSLGDGRWQIIFEDGGKKAVHESDIISVPHLAVGQVVMATFPDSSICLKGFIRRAFNEKSQLYYDVEYSDGAKMVIDKFARKDIFLTPDLAASLLSRQSRGSDKASKFADVDLNNIIPKRSRTSTRAGEGDGELVNSNDSSDVNANCSSSNSHTSPPCNTVSLSNSSQGTSQVSGTPSSSSGRSSKSRGRPSSQTKSAEVSQSAGHKHQSKGRSETHASATESTSASSSSGNISSSSSSASVAHRVVTPVTPGTASTSLASNPPTSKASTSSNSSQVQASVQNKTPNLNDVAEKSRNIAATTTTSSINNNNNNIDNNNIASGANEKCEADTEALLGPIPPYGSSLFRGLAFLLTTADAPTNAESEASSGQGRSTAPFDIPHLVKQIESGGGHVYQTLEEARVSTYIPLRL